MHRPLTLTVTLYTAIVLASLVQAEPFGRWSQKHSILTGRSMATKTVHRRAGAKMPIPRKGGFPSENAPTEGVTDSLRISVCADDHLWKFDSDLSPDEWFLDTKRLKEKMKEKDEARYERVKDKAVLLARLAKFDAWGLKARFSTNNDDCSKVSVRFAHPAVPAYNLREEDQIQVAPAENPYLDFFKWPKGEGAAEHFDPQWVPSLIWGLEEFEKGHLTWDAGRWEHFRFGLEAISNTTAAIKTITYNEDLTRLSPEDENILFNADHSPVFLTGSLAGVDFVKSVSNASHLDDLAQTAFTNGRFNNPTSVQLTNVNKQFEFARFFDVNPSTREDYKQLLKRNSMGLIYLRGAEKVTFDKSPDMLNEAWTIFANGRFEQVKI